MRIFFKIILSIFAFFLNLVALVLYLYSTNKDFGQIGITFFIMFLTSMLYFIWKPKKKIQNKPIYIEEDMSVSSQMYPIKYNSGNPKKTYEINVLEEKFFMNLNASLEYWENKSIYLYRMSTGCISVYYGTYPIGKIKLQGRKHYMQILDGLYGITIIDSTVDEFIANIPKWVDYLRRL